MTPERRIELQKQMAEHGLTVVLTRDYNSILIQLARLAEFQRLMKLEAKRSIWVDEAIKLVEFQQSRFDQSPPRPIPLEIVDIPAILAHLNRELQANIDSGVTVDHEALPGATAAFVGTLFRR